MSGAKKFIADDMDLSEVHFILYFICLLAYTLLSLLVSNCHLSVSCILFQIEIEFLVGMLNIVAAFGGLLAGYVADRFGRRKTIGMACALFLVGAITMSVAPNYPILVIGTLRRRASSCYSPHHWNGLITIRTFETQVPTLFSPSPETLFIHKQVDSLLVSESVWA